MKRYLDVKNNRLVYIGKKADREMWEERWEKDDIDKLFMKRKLRGNERVIIETTQKFLPKGSRILEGGCGLGNYVHMLGSNGYEVTGVDYAKKTIEKTKSIMPSLDVRCGNLESLQFDNDYFDGYWSFGVIEHFYDGYDNIAKEMFRVLRPGGYLFLTVPAFSKLRRIKATLGFIPVYREAEVNLIDFYQFALSPDEVNVSFCKKGFEILEHKGWNVYKGISDEIPLTRIAISFLTRMLGGITERVFGNFCSHMYLFVFRKKVDHVFLDGLRAET